MAETQSKGGGSDALGSTCAHAHRRAHEWVSARQRGGGNVQFARGVLHTHPARTHDSFRGGTRAAGSTGLDTVCLVLFVVKQSVGCAIEDVTNGAKVTLFSPFDRMAGPLLGKSSFLLYVLRRRSHWLDVRGRKLVLLQDNGSERIVQVAAPCF